MDRCYCVSGCSQCGRSPPTSCHSLCDSLTFPGNDPWTFYFGYCDPLSQASIGLNLSSSQPQKEFDLGTQTQLLAKRFLDRCCAPGMHNPLCHFECHGSISFASCCLCSFLDTLCKTNDCDLKTYQLTMALLALSSLP